MRRFLIIALSLLAVLAVLLVVNAVIVGNETEPAKASNGSRVLDLPGGDLNVTDRGPRDAPTTTATGNSRSSLDSLGGTGRVSGSRGRRCGFGALRASAPP